jgi:hypothetical protein
MSPLDARSPSEFQKTGGNRGRADSNRGTRCRAMLSRFAVSRPVLRRTVQRRPVVSIAPCDDPDRYNGSCRMPAVRSCEDAYSKNGIPDGDGPEDKAVEVREENGHHEHPGDQCGCQVPDGRVNESSETYLDTSGEDVARVRDNQGGDGDRVRSIRSKEKYRNRYTDHNHHYAGLPERTLERTQHRTRIVTAGQGGGEKLRGSVSGAGGPEQREDERK